MRLFAWLCAASVCLHAGEANLVDRFVDAKLSEVGAPVAEPASDSEFIRRVHLDLIGRLPDVAETKK